MVEAIALDKTPDSAVRRVARGRVWAIGDVLGVPCKLGRKGLEQIVQIELTPEERVALGKSAEHVKESMAVVTF